MTKRRTNPRASAMGRVWSTLGLYARSLRANSRPVSAGELHARKLDRLMRCRRPVAVRLAVGAGVLGVVIGGCVASVSWMVASGPVSLNVLTPWLASAIQERFPPGHKVELGGTQLERDETGRTALRMRDIVVRDATGSIVAAAPKAEVGIAGVSLLAGRLRTERLSLIGAELAVRLEPDGQISVFAGEDSRAVTKNSSAAGVPQLAADDSRPFVAPAPDGVSAFLAWIQGLDALGLDGADLNEIGLKNGSLTVEDRRKGKRWTFANINMSLTRPKEGGLALNLSSGGADGPWSISATVAPQPGGGRVIEAVVRDISPKDILLALRLEQTQFEADVPLSAVFRAVIGAEGAAELIEGRVLAGAGFIGETGDPDTRILIDEASVNVKWDPAKRTLLLPIEIASGKNRAQVLGTIEAPRAGEGTWFINIPRGRLEFGTETGSAEPPLLLDRVAMRARLDTVKRRLEFEQGDAAGPSARITIGGFLDYAGAEPRLAMDINAGRMSAGSLKRLWPVFVKPPLRAWVKDHVLGGTIERASISTNAPLNTLRNGGPPVPDDGLTIEVVAMGAIVRPLETLPVVRDSELLAKVVGRAATVSYRGTVDMPSGRLMSLASGTFEVPDTGVPMPPARIKLRIEGPMEAAAELTTMQPLRDASGAPFDPANTRGSVIAQLSMGLPLRSDVSRAHVTYSLDADLTNFSAEKMVRGQKAEANSIRISANQNGMVMKGDVRIGGVQSAIEYRKPRGDADAEIRAQAMLDDAARSKLGLDLGNAIAGAVPVRLNGRIGSGDRDTRISVDADLTQAKLNDLLPGWIKPAGKPLKASFSLLDKGQSVRVEDLVMEGSGTQVRGSFEVDNDGELVAANFPAFNLSDGDKANLKAERTPDGTLRIALRGDVYDARSFVKSALSGSANDPKNKRSGKDFDLEIKASAVAGHHGEALRGLDLRVVRRAGQIRTFALNAKLGRDAGLSGDLRAESGSGGRQVLFLETNDAGSFFRFTDTYPRVVGGRMWLTIDPPRVDRSPQNGVLNIRDFAVRGEAALDRVAVSQPIDNNDRSGAITGSTSGGGGVPFARMKVEFTRVPGQLTIRDGVVYGAAVGATMDGQFDFTRNNVQLRGTFVPAYALNNMVARVPIIGFFLGGGQNEGLLGVTYEVVGSPNAPVLRVNPISAVAPGFLRKLFEFRSVNDNQAIPPAPIR